MTLRQYLHKFTTQRQNSILSASIVLAITFGLSAILGFLRSRFLYSQFFACCVTQLDAYNAAFRLPDLIFKLLVTGALSASFIPVFSSYLHKDEKQAYRMASTIVNLLLILFSIAALVILIFARPFSGLIASGFSPEQINLMVDLSRILLIAQLFFLISNFITGILQVHQAFIIPAFSPIVYNLFIILSIFTLAPSFGIYGVTYGAVIGAFFHLAIQVPIAKKFGFRYSPSLDLSLKGVREVFRLMLPRSLSLGLGEIENTVTLFFASNLASGSISLLNLALQLIYLPSRIFGTTIGQASLPILSKNVAQNELDKFKSTVNRAIAQSIFIALPVSTLFLILRVPLVRIAFGARTFPWSATLLTAKTLAFLTPAIVCQAVIQILIRSFYALHNTKTPLYVSILSLLVNISSSYYFVNFTNLGIVGLAISASLGNICQLCGLFYLFSRQVEGFSAASIFHRFVKIFASSLIMGVIIWFTVKVMDLFLLDTAKTISLIIVFTVSLVLGLISFSLASWKLKVDEINDYRGYISKLFTSFRRLNDQEQ
jgi:putative peptidoglycan lipid II flippase